MATGGDCRVSRSLKSRPAFKGTPSTPKNPPLTRLKFETFLSGDARPSTRTLSFQKPLLPSGVTSACATAATSGSAASRSRRSRRVRLLIAIAAGRAIEMRDERRHQTLVVKSRIRGEQVVERACEQQRAQKQHQRQGDLRDHQATAQAEALATGGDPAPDALERHTGGNRRRAQRGCHAKQQTRKEGDAAREAEHPPVPREVDPHRRVVAGEHVHEHADSGRPPARRRRSLPRRPAPRSRPAVAGRYADARRRSPDGPQSRDRARSRAPAAGSRGWRTQSPGRGPPSPAAPPAAPRSSCAGSTRRSPPETH